MSKQEYMQRYNKEYSRRPEVIKHKREYMKEYHQRPGVRERISQQHCRVTRKQNKAAIGMWLGDGFKPLERDKDKQPIFKKDREKTYSVNFFEGLSGHFKWFNQNNPKRRYILVNAKSEDEARQKAKQIWKNLISTHSEEIIEVGCIFQ